MIEKCTREKEKQAPWSREVEKIVGRECASGPKPRHDVEAQMARQRVFGPRPHETVRDNWVPSAHLKRYAPSVVVTNLQSLSAAELSLACG